MTVEQGIRAQLLATGAVTALVSTRVYQLRIPQTSTYPAIRIQLISQPEEAHLRGYTDLTRARVQVDCYAATYMAVASVADAVMDALRPLPFQVEDDLKVVHVQRIDRRPMFEADEFNVVRMFQDFLVWSQPLAA